MTSTPCQSAALDRIIAPWAWKIAEFFATIVEIIIMIAENFRSTLQDLGAGCRNTGRWLLALCSGLSRPMMSKLGFLPPSASVLHVLTRKSSPEFERFVSLTVKSLSKGSKDIERVLKVRARMPSRKESAQLCAGL